MKLEYYNTYEKEFGNIIPPFNRGINIKKIDIFPLRSYAKIHRGDADVKRMTHNIFVDTESGWIIRITNRKAFRKCKWFYVGYFMNKRPGKRYIYGLTANKKVILAGICTHISCKIENQKNNDTMKSLNLGRKLTRKRWNNQLNNAHIFNMREIDNKVFKFMKNPKRFYPKWAMIYNMAQKSKMYYR